MIVPNGIFHDPRLSLVAKGLLAYLLSLPSNWEVRHDALQRKLGIGRKLLEKAFRELVAAGYIARDEVQGRDEHNRFTTLNYIVSDIADRTLPDVPFPVHSKPSRKRSIGNNKEEINTDSTKPFPKPLSAKQVEPKMAYQDKFSVMGEHARAAGNQPVFVDSEPYKAWKAYLGNDGMPGFVDRAVIGGKLRKIVWMPSVFPPLTPVSLGQGGTKSLEE